MFLARWLPATLLTSSTSVSASSRLSTRLPMLYMTVSAWLNMARSLRMAFELMPLKALKLGCMYLYCSNNLQAHTQTHTHNHRVQ